MKNNAFTVLLVDDEIYALHILEDLLRKRRFIERVETATRKVQALELAFNMKPDIIFQDIRMGQESGLDLVDEYRKLNISSEIVFVTAYEQYAIEAIRKAAFDYLLKPVDPDELDAMLIRIRSKYSQRNHENPIPVGKLKIPTRRGFLLLDHAEIVYCEADGNYTNITTKDGSKLISSVHLGKTESILLKSSFIRLSRSVLVNSQYIKEVNKGKKNCILMAGGREYSFFVSATKLKELELLIG